MSHKGKGKGKTSKFDSKISRKKANQQPQLSLSQQFEGALDNICFVEGQMSNGKWHKGRLLSARLCKNYDPKNPKKEDSYDYYIHYEDQNRRMDEWIPINRIRQLDELIPDETKKNQKQKNDFSEYNEHEGFDQELLNEHLEITKIKTISSVQIGKNKMDTWYYSPFPANYQNQDILYFCEFCLNFFLSPNELQRHSQKCILKNPPGDEIYRDDTGPTSISMFEVDGKKNPVYAENLSYFAKLFLDHKNLYWNMDPFLFYILCENDSEGSHIVGYFSKDKESKDSYNLSCILVFPCYQRKGYGKFLIQFSYELSIIEDKIGTPERPLSDLGRRSYENWWVQRIIKFIQSKPKDFQFSVEEITKGTFIRDQDVIFTLEQKGLIKYVNSQTVLCTDDAFLNKVYNDAGNPGVQVKSMNIHWIPYRSQWVKDINIKFPEYNPLEGSNYTYVNKTNSNGNVKKTPKKDKKNQENNNNLNNEQA